MIQIFYSHATALAPLLPCDISARTDSMLAHALLAYGYNMLFSAPLPDRRKTASGKPFFPTHPACHFSLSHSNGHVLCALSSLPVGVDLEEKSRTISPDTVKRLMRPEEKEQFDFLTLWVLRESYFKLTGEGSLRTLFFHKTEHGDICAPRHDVYMHLYETTDVICALATPIAQVPSSLYIVSHHELSNYIK